MHCSRKTVEDTQSDAQEALLVEGYDTDQVDMMSERVILVDHEAVSYTHLTLPTKA